MIDRLMAVILLRCFQHYMYTYMQCKHMLKLYRTMLDSGENYSHAYPSSDHSDVLHYFDVVILIRENHKFTLIFLAIPEHAHI